MINLTKQERDRFVSYLKQEIDSDNIMIEQAFKLEGMDVMIKKMKQRIIAYSITAQEINNIQEME